MVAGARHRRALTVSRTLTGVFRAMYRPGATMVSPNRVIRVPNAAKVSFVLMGAHGLGGWRRRAQATDDVDVLVAKKDHARAVRALHQAFPRLNIVEGAIVTRFTDPKTGDARIDVMRPLQKVYQLVFRHSETVGRSHRVPDLEMALVAKFAAMVSPHRQRERKIQDVADFADMLVHNQTRTDRAKLARLAEQVYAGRVEIRQLVDDILAGRRIEI